MTTVASSAAPQMSPPQKKKNNGNKQPYLCNGQYSHCENKRDGPCDQVEVGRLSRQRLVCSTQGFERCVPGVGEHNKPDDPWHQGVIHDDENDNTRKRLCRSGERRKNKSLFWVLWSIFIALMEILKCSYEGSPSRMVLSLLHTISLRAPSMNWASQPMLPTKKQALT